MQHKIALINTTEKWYLLKNAKGITMIVNRIKKNFTLIITTSLMILYSSSGQTHPEIFVGIDNDESYSVAFKADDSPNPIFAQINKNTAIQLQGIIHNLTVAADDGCFGQFPDLDLEDATYQIVFDRESKVLMLVHSAGPGGAIWTELLESHTLVE